MTTFDESKHCRHQDGKFANKPHAESAGVTLAHSTPTTIQAKMAWTGEDVSVRVTIPYRPAARASHDMSGISEDTLIYSPKTNLVESAGRALAEANEWGDLAPEFWNSLTEEQQDELGVEELLPHVTRQGWETAFDDANIAVATRTGEQNQDNI